MSVIGASNVESLYLSDFTIMKDLKYLFCLPFTKLQLQSIRVGWSGCLLQILCYIPSKKLLLSELKKQGRLLGDHFKQRWPV